MLFSVICCDFRYHTLLNMPRYRFLGSFFISYFLLYLLFAFVVSQVEWSGCCLWLVCLVVWFVVCSLEKYGLV